MKKDKGVEVFIYSNNFPFTNENQQIRKFKKTKSVFPLDQAAPESVYQTILYIERKWTMPIRAW